MKKWGNIGGKLIPLFFIALLIALWQLIVSRGLIARYILPSPWDVLIVCVRILPDIKEHIYTTLQEALTGLIAAIILSVIMAVLMDNFALIREAVQPLLVVSQTVPVMILAPLFAMWFGFGILPKIMVVILVCFFPIVVSLSEGLHSLDHDFLNLMKSIKANRWQIFIWQSFLLL